MIRKLLLILSIAFLIASCGSNSNKQEARKGDNPPEATKVEFAALIANPGDYVGKNISVEGKVVHVCTHSGKKLFITGENPDIRLYVQAGEEMPKFPMELLGSRVVVEGMLTKLAEAPMEGEKGMKAEEGKTKAAGTDTCETEAALAAQVVLSDMMMVYANHSVLN